MSSESVQQVRDRVLQLAREIEQLSKSQAPPDRFFEEFLQRLTAAVGAQAAAVWFVEGNRLTLRSEIRLSDTGLLEDPVKQQANERLLSNVISTGEAGTFSPDDSGENQSPTPHLLILAALHCDKECVGVVEMFQRPDAPQEARPGYLQFLEQMCGLASKYLDQQRTSGSSDAAEFWQSFEQFVLQLQRSLDTQEVTGTAANDGRLLLDCDRLSIAVKRGKKTSITAISGQDAVNPRANLVRGMAALSKNVIRMGEPLLYTGQIDNLPPQIEKPLATYIQESGSRMLIVQPLFESQPLIGRDDDDDRKQKSAPQRQVIGCLLVEQMSESQPKPQLESRAELLAEHVAAAVSNSRQHQRIFLLKFWKLLGQCLEWFHGRKLAKTMLFLFVVGGIVGSLTTVPWEYRVAGEGMLMPVTQKEVFAPTDGEVIELKVEGGARVKADSVLLVLKNKELESQLVNAQNSLAEKSKLLASLKAQIDEDRPGSSEDELTRLLGQYRKTQVEIQGVQAQFEILKQRVDDLTVRAPIDGVVATFQVEQRLMNRPIQRGEVLLEIMDDQEAWHLELNIEEHRMGHILRAASRLDETNDQDHLRVEFRLATDPETTYDGRLTTIATRAAPSSELGNVVEMYVSIDAEDLADRRIGAEVRAKIDCGQRSLGFVLFGDVVEFIQKYFWL
ncbi:MAG: efflux RND transporter periplasmic adaptor subunit [Planctomycetaceae bacterium]